MVKRALLIGINYPGSESELKGCVNDVLRIKEKLLDRFGFEEENITMLIDTDESFELPTGANIRRAFKQKVAESEPGDVLFVHYSGHGVEVPAETGEQDDNGADQCIVPCDMNLITDDDFRDIVNSLVEDVHFTFVSDSCHSGGLIENEKQQIGEVAGDGVRPDLSVEEAAEVDEVAEEEGGGGGGEEAPAEEGEGGEGEEAAPEVAYVEQASRSIPLELLLQQLSQQSGQQVDVGNIRTSLYGMFGDDASPMVQSFVGVISAHAPQLLAALSGEEGGGEGGAGGLFGALQSSALDFVSQQGGFSEGSVAANAAQDADPRKIYAGYKPPAEECRRTGILISGCQHTQTSADACPDGNPANAYGALSNAIITVLEQTAEPISNFDLVTKVRKLLEKTGYEQRPCLYSTDLHAAGAFIAEV